MNNHINYQWASDQKYFDTVKEQTCRKAARLLFTSWELGGEAGFVASRLSDLSEVIKQSFRLLEVT